MWVLGAGIRLPPVRVLDALWEPELRPCTPVHASKSLETQTRQPPPPLGKTQGDTHRQCHILARDTGRELYHSTEWGCIQAATCLRSRTQADSVTSLARNAGSFNPSTGWGYIQAVPRRQAACGYFLWRPLHLSTGGGHLQPAHDPQPASRLGIASGPRMTPPVITSAGATPKTGGAACLLMTHRQMARHTCS